MVLRRGPAAHLRCLATQSGTGTIRTVQTSSASFKAASKTSSVGRSMKSWEQAHIREDSSVKFLRLEFRYPHDIRQPICGFRLHVNDSDMVAAISMEFESCVGFVALFDKTATPPYSGQWRSPDGEWTVTVKCAASGKRIVTSEVQSLLLHHPWFVRTSLEIEPEHFPEICDSVHAFIGAYH